MAPNLWLKKPQTQHPYEKLPHQNNRSSSHTKKKRKQVKKSHEKINFKMAWQWKDRKGFSHNFKSLIGKQRRSCPLCGYSKVPDRPEEWIWDSGDRLKGTFWPQEAWAQTPARQAGMAVAEVMREGMHSPWKTNWVTGLAWRIILVQRVKPNPLFQHDMGWQLSCCCFSNVKAVYQPWASVGKTLAESRVSPAGFPFFSSPSLLLTSPFAWRHGRLSWAQLMVMAGSEGMSNTPVHRVSAQGTKGKPDM